MAFISMVIATFAVILLIFGAISSIIGLMLLIIYFVKKKRSKGILVSSIITLTIGLPITLILSGLFIYNTSNLSSPDTIVINDITYQTGFYSDLFPINIIRTDEKYTVNDNDVYRVNYERFDFMQYSDGTTSYGDIGIDGGQIYCNQEQWEEAKAFYDTPESFVIHARIGTLSENHESKTVLMKNFDYKIFEELYVFSQKKEYNPVMNQDHNNDVVRFRVDSFNNFYENELTIYKESVDGLFTSTKGTHYQIIENKLYLVIHYDYGKGEYNELVCVPVPDGISEYVVKTVSTLTEEMFM